MSVTPHIETLKQQLTSVPVLAYPAFDKPFTLETDASIQGLGAILSQEQEDRKLHPVAYASRALSSPERNYSITELETLAVVWAISHFHTLPLWQSRHHLHRSFSPSRLFSRRQTPQANIPDGGPRCMAVVSRIYISSIALGSADALSRSPQAPAPTGNNDKVQVAVMTSQETSIQSLLQLEPKSNPNESFTSEQRKDPHVREIINFLEQGELPPDPIQARKVVMQEPLFTMVDGILFYLDPKNRDQKWTVVPEHMQREVMEENHRGNMGAISLVTNCIRLLPITGGRKGCTQMPSTMKETVRNV